MSLLQLSIFLEIFKMTFYLPHVYSFQDLKPKLISPRSLKETSENNHFNPEMNIHLKLIIPVW